MPWDRAPWDHAYGELNRALSATRDGLGCKHTLGYTGSGSVGRTRHGLWPLHVTLTVHARLGSPWGLGNS